MVQLSDSMHLYASRLLQLILNLRQLLQNLHFFATGDPGTLNWLASLVNKVICDSIEHTILVVLLSVLQKVMEQWEANSIESSI